jgi:GntR family transcriptional repressor for pyruvate dehydrogenase complex
MAARGTVDRGARTAEPPAALPTLRRERLLDRAVDAIKQHIVANSLQAGDRLPSEPELATSLGVSRNVVRQALSSLEAVGIVRSEHGRGTFVAEHGAATNVLQHLDFWLDIANLDQRDYVETRSVFDAGVLRLAMRNATAEDLERLAEVVRRMEADRPEELRRHHDAFHQALLEATHNRFLAALTMILYRFLWHTAAAAPNVRLVPAADQVLAHRELLDGLRRRDEAEIDRLVGLHLGQ